MIQAGLRGLADVVEQLEAAGIRVSEADPVAWPETTDDGHLSATLVIGVPIDGDEQEAPVATPDDGDGDADDGSEDDETGYWCGRCGKGPMTESGVKIHTGQVHAGDAIVLEHEPDEADLAGDGAEADVLDEDVAADVDEVIEEVTGDAGSEEAKADGGAVTADAPAEAPAEPQAPDLGVVEDPPTAWDAQPFDVPDHVTPETLAEAVDASETIDEVCDAIDWQRRGAVRTLLHHEGLYGELLKPEARGGGDRRA